MKLDGKINERSDYTEAALVKKKGNFQESKGNRKQK